MDAIDAQSVVLALGPAGTGKTYLAIAKAVEALESGKVQRIVLSRPAVEAGESLGFCPATSTRNWRPICARSMTRSPKGWGPSASRRFWPKASIEIAPVAYMRGRTLSECFVVIDEAQNCTYGQIKMLLTRLGWRSTMVLTGDPDQTDLLARHVGLARDRRPPGTHRRTCRWCASPTAISSAIRWWRRC